MPLCCCWVSVYTYVHSLDRWALQGKEYLSGCVRLICTFSGSVISLQTCRLMSQMLISTIDTTWTVKCALSIKAAYVIISLNRAVLIPFWQKNKTLLRFTRQGYRITSVNCHVSSLNRISSVNCCVTSLNRISSVNCRVSS